MMRTGLNPASFPLYALFLPLGINCVLCALTDAVNSYGAITALFAIAWLVRESCDKPANPPECRLRLTDLACVVCGTLVLTQAFYTILMCLLLPRLAGTSFHRWIRTPGGLVWCGLAGAFAFPEGISFECLKVLQTIPSVALPVALGFLGMDCTACDLGIMVGDRYYPVVPTCAGTTCLGASLLLVIAIIGIRRRPLFQGVLLLIFAVMTAVFANQMRVLSLIILDQVWRGSAENASVHDLTGALVYLGGTCALLAFDTWLKPASSNVAVNSERRKGCCALQLDLRYRIALLCVVIHVLCGMFALYRIRLDGNRAAAIRRSEVERSHARTLIDSTARECGLTSSARGVRTFHEEPRKGMWSEGLIVDLPNEQWIIRLDGLFQQPHHLDLCYRLRGDRLLSLASEQGGIQLRHYRTTAGQDRHLAYTHVGTVMPPLSHSALAVQAKYFTEMSWFSREALPFLFGSEIYESGIIQVQAQCIRQKEFVDDKASLQPTEMVATLRRNLESMP
ncbi:MAG: archaeosortase/exosortase family protein [Planctomycetota bacterium]